MTATAIAKKEERRVARPLRVLVPLIKEDLKSAEQAGMSYYQAAGKKLLEAKAQMKHGEFEPWVQRNLGIGKKQSSIYMGLARSTEKFPAGNFSSLGEFIRETSNPNYNLPHTVRPPSWHESVKRAVNKVNVEALNRDIMDRAKERVLRKRLALQIVDIGYKALAQKLHPDKGGSKEAMSRLSDVRKRLNSVIDGLVNFQ